jgi:maltooligosyltrehalose trehalohydrolase
VRTLLTGEQEGYYEEFGEVAQLAKAYRRPFVYDGIYSPGRKRRYGAPAPDRSPEQFVVFSQNHDQVGNRAIGDRMPDECRPLAAFATLLSPFTPMLFMGEEHGEPRPFQFFSDHIDEEIATATRDGRLREFAQFEAFAGQVPDPQDPATFHASKLSWERDPALLDLYRRLIALRATLDSVESEPAFDEALRWLCVLRGDHELVMNFSRQERSVPVDGDDLVLATHDGARVEDGFAVLPPLAGALVR